MACLLSKQCSPVLGAAGHNGGCQYSHTPHNLKPTDIKFLCDYSIQNAPLGLHDSRSHCRYQKRKRHIAYRALQGSAGHRRPYTATLIIPTGIGAAIGGYAGDALPVARTLASVVDCLITHPNVLNAAMLYWPVENALYVEGFGLDQFAAGEWGLRPVHQNRVGLILDAAIEDDLQLRHRQVADATRASLGLSVPEFIVTDQPLQVEKWIDPATGASTGRLGRPDALLRAASHLVEEGGVEAIAVVGRFPDDDLELLEDYRQGQGVDALAGVEAIISHTVVKQFRLPCAHAPALGPIPLEPVAPRSAAEELGHTFLPCVLTGLSRAPQFVLPQEKGRGDIWADEVDAIVVPATACGGDGTLALMRRKSRKPLLIVVEENETVLQDRAAKFGLEAVHVANYWEAVGVIAADKAGVSHEALRRGRISTIAERRTSGPVIKRELLQQGVTI